MMTSSAHSFSKWTAFCRYHNHRNLSAKPSPLHEWLPLSSATPRPNHRLLLARANDGRLVRCAGEQGLTTLLASGLNGTHNLHRLDVTGLNLAEDDVLSIEPRGDDGGDEELGAVAASG